MWGAALPPNPGSSNVSSMGSYSSIKSSWQLTTVPLGAFRNNVSPRPDLLPCLCPVLLHQADGRYPAEAQSSREAPLCPPPYQELLLEAHSSLGPSLSPSTKSSLLPQVTHLQCRSLWKVILAQLLPWGSTGSFSSCQQIWEGHAHSHGGKGRQFIWQRYPRPASSLQHQVNTLHSIIKSCGLGTKNYSCQTHYCSTHLQKYLVVKPSYCLLS